MTENKDFLSGNDQSGLLPIDYLCEDVQSLIRTMARVFQCSQDFITASVFAATMGAVGNRLQIYDGKYTNHLCLWLAMVAQSGENKTTPAKLIMQPLEEEQCKNFRKFRAELKEWNKKQKGKKDEASQTDKPTFTQYLIEDTTPEARYAALAANPNGLLLFADELDSHFAAASRYSASSAVQYAEELQLYMGNAVTINRKTEEPLMLENPFFAMFGGIQPDILHTTFGSVSLMSNGYNQRWNFVWPEPQLPPPYSNESGAEEELKRWGAYLLKLLHQPTLFTGSEAIIKVGSLAKQIYINFFNLLQQFKAEDDGYLASVYSKLQIQCLRLAGLAHVLHCPYQTESDRDTTPWLAPEAMDYAVRCMGYFMQSAQKVYDKIRDRTEKPLGNEQLIAEVCKRYNPSQHKLAEALGITQPAISKALDKWNVKNT